MTDFPGKLLLKFTENKIVVYMQGPSGQSNESELPIHLHICEKAPWRSVSFSVWNTA